MLRTLIIDDEPHIRDTISRLLSKYCPQAKVVGEADSVVSGIRQIKEKLPDLVLLDIKMDDGTGFDLLNYFENIDFKIIFITAYEEFAIQAFGFSAIDYLLKPINPDSLVDAVIRTQQIIQDSFNLQLNNLKQSINNPDNSNKTIVLKTLETIYLVDVVDIIQCESDGGYTKFVTVDDGDIVVSKSLKEYDKLLAGCGFIRAHRSHLINLKKIKRFEKLDGGFVVMTNGCEIPVSSRGRIRLLELFDNIT